MGKSIPWSDFLMEWLSDPRKLGNYLQVSLEEYLEDGDKDFFLHEIKNVIKALGGISNISKRADVNQKVILNTIYKGVMPPFHVLNLIFKTLGLDSSTSMSSVVGMTNQSLLAENSYRIGASRPPEELTEQVKPNDLTERQLLNIMYWEHLKHRLILFGNDVKHLEPSKYNYIDLSIKGTGCALRAKQTVRPKEISASFIMRGARATGNFYSLRVEQEEIEKEFGDKLEWSSNIESEKRISCINENADPTDKYDWHNQHQWLNNTLKNIYRVFKPRVERLMMEF